MTDPLFYAGMPLDRAAHLRRDADWLRGALARADSRFLPLWRDKTLIAEARAVSWAPDRAGAYPDAVAGAILLGRDPNTDAAWWALDLSDLSEDDAAALEPEATFEDLWAVGLTLPAGEAAIAVLAKGLIHWHRRNGHCGRCGHPTEVLEAGHMRRCIDPRCAVVQFPRTDPAVIVLVTAKNDGEDVCLLGRHGRLPGGMYSTLAGFVEPGESLEETVAREIMEESGVPVADVRYVASQPWPFPSSLMIAFTARATDMAITIDQEELEDARWFSRADIDGMEAAGLRLPRVHSVARMMIEDWRRAEF